ncbi:hypothetical protein TEA_010689 [Camellia sinensis var. sinensis]|uniref:Uncharacterized protein n=1 Tax=Camellia sinensis var. sinensis TaxID=542762 RepID=A0A4S4E4B0_CAMSN|nr:hypothetical protein TEA_010689 [Camellia sinensis var. sinensis]
MVGGVTMTCADVPEGDAMGSVAVFIRRPVFVPETMLDIIINFPELRLNDLMSYNQLLVNLILVLLIKHRDRQTKKNPYGKNKADNQIELNILWKGLCTYIQGKATKKLTNIDQSKEVEETTNKYDSLFERNAKTGSFYLQSKVHRAKECLEVAYQKQA